MKDAHEVARFFDNESETFRAGFTGNREVRIHAPIFTSADVRRLERMGWTIKRIGGSQVSVVQIVAEPDQEALYTDAKRQGVV